MHISLYYDFVMLYDIMYYAVFATETSDSYILRHFTKLCYELRRFFALFTSSRHFFTVHYAAFTSLYVQITTNLLRFTILKNIFLLRRPPNTSINVKLRQKYDVFFTTLFSTSATWALGLLVACLLGLLACMCVV